MNKKESAKIEKKNNVIKTESTPITVEKKQSVVEKLTTVRDKQNIIAKVEEWLNKYYNHCEEEPILNFSINLEESDQ